MSVSVLQPASATLGSFAASTSSASSTPAMKNGVQKSINDLSVAEIKDQAKAQASKVSRGASPISLITVARQQIAQARVSEVSGDLKAALSAYIKAVSLIQTFMGNAEFLAEAPAARRGMLFKEFTDFQANEGKDLSLRVNNVETKLKELEASLPGSAHSNGYEESVDDGPVVAPGGSIADRMRALQSAGMSVNTNKRFSRDMPKAPGTPPMSPSTNRLSRRDSSHSMRSAASHSTAHPPASAPLSPPPLQTASFSTASSSSHAFVPTSSLGPPSPTSSNGSSSPQQPPFSMSEFSQAFPSIDELEEMTVDGHANGTSPPNLNGLSLQSPPSRAPLPPLPQAIAASSSFSSVDEYVPSPSVAARQFPVLPTHTGTSASGIRRGSLAAIHPAPVSLDMNAGANVPDPGSPISRPSSPRTSGWVPTSPTVPRKPSNLSLHSSSAPSQPPVAHRPSPPAPGITPNGPSGALNATSPPVSSHIPADKPDLPHMNSVVPKQLHGYLNNPGLKVLLLDVRPREDFERESIQHPGDAVVCIDPSVLQREVVNAQSVEDSLSLAPTIEHTLFANRDKFDLVVMYDAESQTYNPALKALAAAIYETAFQKILKRMPVLLVGGLKAWKSELEDDAVLRSRQNGHDAHHRGRPQRSREHKEHRAHGSEVNGHVPGRPLPSIDGAAALRNRSQTESSTGALRLQSVSRNDALRYTPEGVASTSRTSAPAPMRKPMSPPTQYPSPRPQVDNIMTPMPQTWSSASGSIQYPSFTRNISPSITRASSPTVSTSSFHASGAHAGIVSPPPQASINPSPLSRRRSEIDQSPQLLSHSGAGFRPSIDYPDLSSHTAIRPPPPIAAPTSERQDFRPRLPAPLLEPRAPTIPSDYQVTYWRDASIATSGLKNMGNTCYMNSTIQCLNATIPFAHFFIDGHWQKAVNMLNPIGTKGAVASAFALILRDMWKQEQTYLVPTTFRRSIIAHASQFEGTEQQDCQEFLSFLLGGLHEDLNRILKKPNYSPTPEREAELERLPVQIASEQEWTIYRMRDDSLIVDFFQGQFRNRLQCMTCHHTSTTYNAFMYLTLPIPTKSSKATLQQCLEMFVQKEVMEKDDAWNCPHCKTLRTATKQLSLSRLPPVLLIHLKRFSSKGAGADKIESFVDFPLKSLDLTHFMPDALPPGIDKGVPGAQQLSLDDPRNQTPPYKYDLYGVTNHFGTLTSGHYTAFIANRGGWMYADDSRVVPADPKDVVGKPAYVLYYKRVKT